MATHEKSHYYNYRNFPSLIHTDCHIRYWQNPCLRTRSPHPDMKKAAHPFLHRLLIAVFCCSILLRPVAAADFIELTAEIELNDWSYWFLEDRPDSPTTPNNHRSIFQDPLTIRCVIGTNSWLMEGQFVRNALVTRWFTGSNIVEQTRITAPTSLPTTAKNLRLRVSTPPVGHVSTQTHETSDGNPARPVRVEDLLHDAIGKICWLAFCSGPALKRDGRQIPLPSALWKQFFSGRNFTDRTETFDDPLALPRTIELHENNQHLLLNYQVRSFTNIRGWNIPLEFYLLQYKPAPHPRTNSLEVHLTAKGRVTNLQPGSAPSIPR